MELISFKVIKHNIQIKLNNEFARVIKKFFYDITVVALRNLWNN